MKRTNKKVEKVTDLSLKESEVRYRRLFEAAQDGILILDAETGMIEDVNPYLINVLGYSREEFIKKKLWEVGAFKDIEASQEAFEALQDNEYIRYEDLPLKAKDGQLIQVEFVSNVYLVGNKKVIQCNIRDITARKQAEAGLRESDARFRSTLESMMEGCQIIGYDWRYLFINDSAVVQGKLNREELLGHTMMECYPGIENTDMFAMLRRCMDERTAHIMVNEFIYPDGSKGWFELSIQPLPIGIFILSSDITAPREADEALKASKLMIEGIINAIPVRVFWKDMNLVYLGCNAVFARDAGFSDPKDVIGKDDYQMGWHDQAELYRSDDRQVIESGTSKLSVEEPSTTPEGNIITLLTSKVALRNSEGEIIGVLGTYMDITERKRAEQEIVSLAKFPSENPNLVMRLSRDGLVMFANAASSALLSMWGCAVGGTAPQFWRDLAAQTLASGENKTVDIECDGKVYSMVVAPVAEAGHVNLYGRDITERKQAEETLHESREELYRLLNSIAEGAYGVDVNGNCTFVNRAFLQILGYQNDHELLGKHVHELIHHSHPDGSPYPSSECRMYRAYQNNQPINVIDEVFWRKDGVAIPVEYWSHPIEKDGVVIGSIATFVDITERKRSKEALELAYSQLTNFYNDLPEALFSLDVVKNEMLQVSPAHEAIFGYPRDEFFKNPQLWYEIMVPEDKPKVDANYPILMAGRILQQQFRIIRQDEEMRWIEAIIRPTLAEDGKLVRLDGIASDITERKQREEQMTQLNMAVANSGEAIFMTDCEGVITFVNPGFTQLYGHTADEIVGKTTPRILKSGAMKPEVYTAFWQTLLTKQVVKGELINKTKDGRLLNIEGWSSPIINQKEEIVGFMGLQHDITQRKMREEEILNRNEELTTLYNLSRALADTNDLASVFDLVNRHAVESVHVTFACIAIMEEGELVPRAVYPVRSLEYDFKVGGRHPITTLPVCQRVLDKNESVILQAGNIETSNDERDFLLLNIAKSVCLMPLQLGDTTQGSSQALGLLILGEAREEKREPFTPEKIRLARSISDQAASAIRRLLLREQSGRRLQHLTSLSEIDRSIASNFDLHLSLKLILQHVIEQLEVDAADVLVFNTGLQTLEFAAGHGFRSTDIEHKRLRLGEGQAGLAALERRIVQIQDVIASGATFAQPELLKAEHVATYFGVPLIIKGQVKGVLEIYQRTLLEPNKEWLDFLNNLAGQAAIAIDVVQLFDSLQRSNIDLSQAYDATIEGWSHALDLRDKETEGHTQRVTEMTVKLGRAFDLSEAELVQVRWGALLHDIGKMGVPDGILHKPGPLTDEEWVVMKKHPDFAYEMLSPIRYLRLALDIPYSHHEKWDGTGYPRGLKGEQIPLTARIFAVVDVWDALTSDRVYRPAWSREKVIEHIKAGSGKHFDPQVVKIFINVGLPMSQKKP